MKLSVIIPVYNEKATIVELLDRVLKVPVDKEIVLVDDASSDGTQALIRERLEGKYPALKVLYHTRNQGKGSAIRTGLKEAAGDVVLIQDADLEYDPMDYIRILDAFETRGAKVVYGTRFSQMNAAIFFKKWLENVFLRKGHELKSFHFFFGIQFLNLLTNVLYGACITDEATCYKAFRREVLASISLKCRGFEFCPEVTAKVKKAGYDILEVPVSYHPRSHEEGKKLNWRHGLEAMETLLRYRFTD